MKEKRMEKTDVTLKTVQQVYDGPEAILWELIMGEQIHVGGFKSSLMLAERAGIRPNMHGLDLCSALGAGCRFLVRNFSVTMVGYDGTTTMIQKARQRAMEEGFGEKIQFIQGDVTELTLPDKSFDFVWGEDAWCYVDDKDRLIGEAARVLKPGGILAFTDWVEGPQGLSNEEAKRINTFMKFPYMESQKGYESLIEKQGLTLLESTDLTEEYAEYVDFYIRMLVDQLRFDALNIIGWNMELFEAMGNEMAFMAEKAHEGKMGRARFIARR
jgi:ubiquinone/menaquinone biosynthesis C-methylase UbiE